ncbi:transcriptional repressor LexA [Lacticaseibacillus saniviri]|uniref:LexA repressor n=1 Tax=Lacticaseibacillus saniviri JCM 17471 = DSM 24301 TaxID=1293598 RepID=A0A0R2MP80_9LACO|nr:transcriptional repressor LexA [Lacticaseibacillus saniviri]KRO15470.1 Transcriptional regulator, xre family protein [Lacticaseibacillus saniviri JCM 17471 = DSM 24301]MCG4282266.1 transcriptional repressor LexA [Lacticaseibacillus saniviri]
MPTQASQKRWKDILVTIHDSIENRGYPPTVREIGKAVGLSSSSTVAAYLEKLNNEGLIAKDPSKPRTLEITSTGLEYIGVSEALGIPIVGTVAAGVPITAIENVEDYFPLPDDLNYAADDLFMLRVQGESMIKIGILNGDQIIVKKQSEAENGQIVVAMTEENEATVKRFFKEDHRIRLHPENDTMADMYFDSVTVLGVVVSLYRPALV